MIHYVWWNGIIVYFTSAWFVNYINTAIHSLVRKRTSLTILNFIDFSFHFFIIIYYAHAKFSSQSKFLIEDKKLHKKMNIKQRRISKYHWLLCIGDVILFDESLFSFSLTLNVVSSSCCYCFWCCCLDYCVKNLYMTQLLCHHSYSSSILLLTLHWDSQAPALTTPAVLMQRTSNWFYHTDIASSSLNI